MHWLLHGAHGPSLAAPGKFPPMRAQGVQMQPASVTQFQSHIMSGQWNAAMELLPRFASGRKEVLREAQFLVRPQT